MTDRPRIYVAGPITLGDPERNLRRAIDAADTLLRFGAAPFVPHLHMAWHAVHPHEHAEWMAFDVCWLQCCDALLRLPGESVGADAEVEWCETHGTPVLRSLGEADLWIPRYRRRMARMAGGR